MFAGLIWLPSVWCPLMSGWMSILLWYLQIPAEDTERAQGVPEAARPLPSAAGGAGQIQAASGKTNPAQHHAWNPNGKRSSAGYVMWSTGLRTLLYRVWIFTTQSPVELVFGTFLISNTYFVLKFINWTCSLSSAVRMFICSAKYWYCDLSLCHFCRREPSDVPTGSAAAEPPLPLWPPCALPPRWSVRTRPSRPSQS